MRKLLLMSTLLAVIAAGAFDVLAAGKSSFYWNHGANPFERNSSAATAATGDVPCHDGTNYDNCTIGEAVANAGSLTLADGDNLNIGTSSDITIEYNATDGIVTSGPATGLWAGAPSALDPDPSRFHAIFDDFNKAATSATSDVHTWVKTTGAGGTQLMTDAAGGVFNVVTTTTDNDHVAHSTYQEEFLFVAGAKTWCEARFKLAEATTNESAIWFGFTDTLTTGGFQANAAGPLASYDGALIWKDEATMTVDFETSNAGTQATTSAIATAVTDTWNRWGFYCDGTATTTVCTPYVAINDTDTFTAGTVQNITLAGLEEMHMVIGVKAGPTAAAETLQVDYVKCVQLR